MARELRNITGQTLWVDDSRGGLAKVDPDGIYVVARDDDRYFQTGDTGETALWEEVTKEAPKAANKKENG